MRVVSSDGWELALRRWSALRCTPLRISRWRNSAPVSRTRRASGQCADHVPDPPALRAPA